MTNSANLRLMYKSQKRYIILIIVLIILVAIALLITTILFVNNKYTPNKELNTRIINEARKIANSDRTDENLNSLFDPKLSQTDRSTKINNILFDLRARYYAIHDPEIRKFIAEDFKEYVKKNFPENYNEDDFIVACSDPECGQNINSDLNNIIDDIQKSEHIPDYAKNTILKNLHTVGYSPDDSLSDKTQNVFGLELVIGQLEELGTPQASDSAKSLINYLKVQYNYNYFIHDYEEPK